MDTQRLAFALERGVIMWQEGAALARAYHSRPPGLFEVPTFPDLGDFLVALPAVRALGRCEWHCPPDCEGNGR